jgi:SOS-response transcriptional repressor LexA
VPLPGELEITRDRRVSIYNTEAGPDIKGEYPLISWVQAGDWMQIVDNFNPGDAESYYAAPKKCGPQTFLLRVRGPSMEPKYSDGELIYVDPGVQWEHGKNVVVKLVDEQEATFKNLVVEGNKMWLRPLNPDWPEQVIPLEESARIVGVVIGKYVPD